MRDGPDAPKQTGYRKRKRDSGSPKTGVTAKQKIEVGAPSRGTVWSWFSLPSAFGDGGDLHQEEDGNDCIEQIHGKETWANGPMTDTSEVGQLMEREPGCPNDKGRGNGRRPKGSLQRDTDHEGDRYTDQRVANRHREAHERYAEILQRKPVAQGIADRVIGAIDEPRKDNKCRDLMKDCQRPGAGQAVIDICESCPGDRPDEQQHNPPRGRHDDRWLKCVE